MSVDVDRAFSSGKKSLIIFLDLLKAFDSVDRKRLLEKLEPLGIRGVAYDWFVSYFDNRKQFVCINGFNGGLSGVEYGVIQGSTLGPILFLLYINDICKIKIHGKMYLFADDTAIFVEGFTWEEVFEKASADLALLKTWFDQNILTINISKTKFLPMSLRSRGDTAVNNIKIHSYGCIDNLVCACDMIMRVDEYKYLGIVMDHRRNWAAHISYINNKLRKYIYVFRQLHGILSLNEVKLIYYAFVQSVVLGGIVVWGGAYKTTIQPLITTQKMILKAALGKNLLYPSDFIFNEFKVLDVRQLYVKNLLLYLFKYPNGIYEDIQHQYPTRFARRVHVRAPVMSKSFLQTSSLFICHIIKRNLPSSLSEFEQSCSFLSYKKLVNSWLLELGRDNIDSIIKSEYRR
jgi:hypothetical protein